MGWASRQHSDGNEEIKMFALDPCERCPDGVFDPPGAGGPGGWFCSLGFEPDEPECPFAGQELELGWPDW